MAEPLTGWIPPQDRTKQQHEAHYAALAHAPRFAIPGFRHTADKVKVILTKFWSNPDVVADVGAEFTGFHQLTGSCALPGTPVRLADGTDKPIESFRGGEMVITHRGRPRQVIRPTTRSYTGRMIGVATEGSDRPEVMFTECHRFLNQDSVWKPIGQFSDRDLLVRDGRLAATLARRTERDVEKRQVHCLQVDEDRSFLVNGIATHNCVGASSGNAQFTVGAVQRTIADAPTKAFVPWWPFAYGRTRANEGDRGQGEGAVDSVMGQTLAHEGTFDMGAQGLPKFSTDDGWYLTQKLEYQWSDGNSSLVKGYAQFAQDHTLTAAPVYEVEDVRAAIINGYPILYGCDLYVGNASIKGSGDTAYVCGKYDGRGGHSTCWAGVYDHPNDGPLYLYSNQWPSSTYPKDPAGGGRCCTWIPESEVVRALKQLGSGGGEAMALSHLRWFPAQPKVLTWFI